MSHPLRCEAANPGIEIRQHRRLTGTPYLVTANSHLDSRARRSGEHGHDVASGVPVKVSRHHSVEAAHARSMTRAPLTPECNSISLPR